MNTKSTLIILFLLLCCFERPMCVASNFDPLVDHLSLRTFATPKEADQRHHVNQVEINWTQAHWGSPRGSHFGKLDISDQIFSRDPKAEIHEMSALLASTSQRLAENSEQTSYSGANRAADQSSRGHINLHDLVSIVGWALLGASFVLIPWAVLFFLIWWFDTYRSPFPRGPNIPKNQQR